MYVCIFLFSVDEQETVITVNPLESKRTTKSNVGLSRI